MIYMAGPITANDGFTVQDNRRQAITVYFQLVKAGCIPFCPNLSSCDPGAYDGISYEQWLAYDFAVIDACDTVLMLPRWRTSKGAVREYDYALQMGKRVVYDVKELLACPECGGMGTTTHDILVGGTEHDTEERYCAKCLGTGKGL